MTKHFKLFFIFSKSPDIILITTEIIDFNYLSVTIRSPLPNPFNLPLAVNSPPPDPQTHGHFDLLTPSHAMPFLTSTLLLKRMELCERAKQAKIMFNLTPDEQKKTNIRIYCWCFNDHCKVFCFVMLNSLFYDVGRDRTITITNQRNYHISDLHIVQ